MSQHRHHRKVTTVLSLALQAADLAFGLSVGSDHEHTAEAITLAVLPHVG